MYVQLGFNMPWLTGNERGDGSNEIGDQQINPRERCADEKTVLLVTLTITGDWKKFKPPW